MRHPNHLHGDAGRVTSLNGRKRPTPEYLAWVNMRRRCMDPNNPGYRRYGARGIAVCERWSSYDLFLEDVGRRPSSKHSLDRYPNPDGNYEPGNVRWATSAEQAINKSSIIVTPLAAVLMRGLHRRRIRIADLARAFEVDRAVVDKIVRRRNWKRAIELLQNGAP